MTILNLIKIHKILDEREKRSNPKEGNLMHPIEKNRNSSDFINYYFLKKKFN